MKSMRFGGLVARTDNKVGVSHKDLSLFSVSQTKGVVPFSELNDRPPRADSFEDYKVVQPGDIAFNKMSIRSGALGIAPRAGMVTYHYETMRARPGADPRYVCYLMKSDYFISELISRERGIGAGGATGVRTTEVPFTVLRTIPTPRIGPNEQRRIADYLDHETAEIDATIKEQSALRGLIYERRSASIDLAYQDAAQRATRLRPIKYSFRINPTVNRATRKIPQDSVYLPMNAIGEFGGIDTSWARPTAEMMSGYTYVENGDVIVAKVTPCFENGKGAVITGLPDGLGFATTEVTNFRPAGPNLPEYLAVVFRTSRFRLGGEAEMTGAGGLRRVPDRYMTNFKMAELTTREQHELIDHVGEIDRASHGLVQDLDKAIALARERRAALITAAVTGQIDVTARNKPAAEQLEDDIAQGLHREN